MLKTKAQLVRAMAEGSGLTRSECGRAYNALVALIYSHAAEGASLPGLCRFRVVERAERRVRNPRSGQKFLLKAHKALVVKLSKTARSRIAPLPPDCRVPVTEEAPAAQWIVFGCRACGTQLEASADMRGREAVCPGCGAAVTVPLSAEPSAAGPVSPATAAPTATMRDLRAATIRIELPEVQTSPNLRPRKFAIPRRR